MLSASTNTRSKRTHLLTNSPADLLNERQVAGEFNISVKTLQNWRYHGKGPAYHKAESKVLYRRTDVESWLQARRVEPA